MWSELDCRGKVKLLAFLLMIICVYLLLLFRALLSNEIIFASGGLIDNDDFDQIPYQHRNVLVMGF